MALTVQQCVDIDLDQVKTSLAPAVLAGTVLSELVLALPIQTRTVRLAGAADRVPWLERAADDLWRELEEVRTRNTDLKTILKGKRKNQAAHDEDLTKTGDEHERKVKVRLWRDSIAGRVAVSGSM